MSSSNYCFLICIHVLQEAGQVVWYSHLFQNFPQFVVIHTVKGFGMVNEAEVDVFLEFPYFFYDPVDVGNLISGYFAFLNPTWTSGSSRFTYWDRLSWVVLFLGFMYWLVPQSSEGLTGSGESTSKVSYSYAWRVGGGWREASVPFLGGLSTGCLNIFILWWLASSRGRTRLKL